MGGLARPRVAAVSAPTGTDPVARRRGFAIVTVVLILLALSGLAHGALLLSRFQERAARAGRDQLRTRAAALAGASSVAWADGTASSDSTPIWGTFEVVSGRLGRVEYSGRLERLSAELWLAQGTARSETGMEARVGRVVWVLDPVARLREWMGVVVVGDGPASVLSGIVDRSDLGTVRAPLPLNACDDVPGGLAAALPISGVDELFVVPDSEFRALGRFDISALLARLPPTVSGVGAAAPALGLDGCDVRDPWNWGDPDWPTSPCGEHIAPHVAEGALTVDGGIGQGLVVTGGDLILRNGTRLYGVLIVGGRLLIDATSRLTGLARARQGVKLAAGGRIDASVCWAYRALRGAGGGLRRPVGLPEAGLLDAPG
jgi:hypothetical protein